MWVKSKVCLWGIGLPLLLTSVVTAQEPILAPPPPAPPTLWNFLGIPQGVRKVQGAVRNQSGNRPQAEPKPPLRAIGDPINLFSKNDAIKQAAKVKQEEDLKPQKIKAIKYLATIGCGCYDKDGDITKALIAAMEDCTEDVRLVTMEELYNIATGKCCSNCGSTCCCKEPLLRKLAQIAYEKDEFGCYIEPSQRVREGAIRVLHACCSNPVPPLIESPPAPAVVPTDPLPIDPERPRIDAEEIQGERALEEQRQRALGEVPVTLKMSDKIPAQLASTTLNLRAMPSRDMELVASPNPEGGVVIGYNAQQRLAYVHFEDQRLIAEVGSTLYIKVDPIRGKGFRGTWKVIASDSGRANLTPVEADPSCVLAPGDHVFFGLPPVTIVPVGFVGE